MLPEFSLEGRTAIVTGGGRGIGRAIALVLAEAGANVVVSARTQSEIVQTAKEVEALGRRALAVQADVSSSSQVDAMVEQALGRFDRIDILVNNAGKLLRMPVVPLSDQDLAPPLVSGDSSAGTTDDAWSEIMRTNLDGVFYCARAVARHMIPNGYGKIINIGSNNALQAFPLVAAYNASKAAVNMLTRVLALEWAAYNICVNAIGPGDYHTEMTDPTWTDPEGRRRHLEGIPFKREGDVREIGRASCRERV